MASVGINYFADKYLKVSVHCSFPLPLSSVASSCCQGPRFAGEIHLLCQWEPTSPFQAVQTNTPESKTRSTLLLKPRNPNSRKQFVHSSLPTDNGGHCGSHGTANEGKQRVPRTLLLYRSKRDKEKFKCLCIILQMKSLLLLGRVSFFREHALLNYTEMLVKGCSPPSREIQSPKNSICSCRREHRAVSRTIFLAGF